MKKIDLHIHTINTKIDNGFTYDFDILKKYVEATNLDCIAITNHNEFHRLQYEQISNELQIKVLPGIEINLDKGHILIISNDDYDKLNAFEDKCNDIQNHFAKEDNINIDKFKSIFYDLDEYIVIPHYKKRPAIADDILNLLNSYIYCGEVKNEKDFYSVLKDHNSITPVLFSDFRPCIENENKYPFRQTYIEANDVSFKSLQLCLRDKNSVHINNKKAKEMFQVLSNGFSASTGLNVILGERSSGKSYTLNQINAAFENVKYIKQFSLMEKDSREEDKKFSTLIKNDQSLIFEEYLQDFRKIIDDVINIDLNSNDICLQKYIESLVEYATSHEKLDSYSKAQLYSENEYEITDIKELEELISATLLLISNTKYSNLIYNIVSREILENLLVSLVKEFKTIKWDNNKKEIANSLIRNIKLELNINTEIDPIEDCKFKKILMDSAKANKFNEVVSSLQVDKVIESKDIFDFKMIAMIRKIKNATELRQIYEKNISFVDVFDKYDEPFNYLMVLKNKREIENTKIYKLFIKLDYQIKNKYGADISGGERSEYNLLNELSNGENYDLLLIDEPESSFDNLFLNRSVNNMIKKISQKLPVFLITHNNSVGKSIKPNYLIYTKRTISNGNAQYNIYGGLPTDDLLIDINGNTIENYRVLIDCLEGGEQVYKERKRDYEILQRKKQ